MKYITRLVIVVLFVPVIVLWYCIASVIATITLLQFPIEFVLFGTLRHRPIMATYIKSSVRLLYNFISWLDYHKFA